MNDLSFLFSSIYPSRSFCFFYFFFNFETSCVCVFDFDCISLQLSCVSQCNKPLQQPSIHLSPTPPRPTPILFSFPLDLFISPLSITLTLLHRPSISFDTFVLLSLHLCLFRCLKYPFLYHLHIHHSHFNNKTSNPASFPQWICFLHRFATQQPPQSLPHHLQLPQT